MVGRTKAPNAAQRRRMEALSRSRCIACDLRDVRQPNQTEIHHIVDKGNREASGGHDATLPLCSWHHRGVPSFQAMRGKSTERRMADQYGPSLALQKRAFVEVFGTERRLLLIVNAMLEVEAEALKNDGWTRADFAAALKRTLATEEKQDGAV